MWWSDFIRHLGPEIALTQYGFCIPFGSSVLLWPERVMVVKAVCSGLLGGWESEEAFYSPSVTLHKSLSPCHSELSSMVITFLATCPSPSLKCVSWINEILSEMYLELGVWKRGSVVSDSHHVACLQMSILGIWDHWSYVCQEEPSFKGKALLVMCGRECGWRGHKFICCLCSGRLQVMAFFKRVKHTYFCF